MQVMTIKMCVMEETTIKMVVVQFKKKSVFLVSCTYYIIVEKFSHSSCIIGKH